MGTFDRIWRKGRKYLILLIFMLSIFPGHSVPLLQKAVQAHSEGDGSSNRKNRLYKSAFNPFPPASGKEMQAPGNDIHYTIQICTLPVQINDLFLNGQYNIKTVRMGDLYRYIFSGYTALDSARKELPEVRKIFPKAFIREYDGKKLGEAVDMNIEHLE